jgi:hypothetical protein
MQDELSKISRPPSLIEAGEPRSQPHSCEKSRPFPPSKNFKMLTALCGKLLCSKVEVDAGQNRPVVAGGQKAAEPKTSIPATGKTGTASSSPAPSLSKHTKPKDLWQLAFDSFDDDTKRLLSK